MKRSMKCMTLLTVLMLLVSLCPLALAAEGDVTLRPIDVDNTNAYNEGAWCIRAEGDKLYIGAGNAIYVWTPGDAAEKPYVTGLNTGRVITDDTDADADADTADAPAEGEADDSAYFLSGFDVKDGVIYGYDFNSNYAVFSIRPDENGKPVYGDAVKLDLDDLMTDEGDYAYLDVSLVNVFVMGERLYVNGSDYNANQALLFSFDLATGERVDYDLPFVQRAAPYKDGKLICQTIDTMNAYDEETGKIKPFSLTVFDPETGDAEEAAQVDLPYHRIFGMQYDADSDTLYLALANKIYRMVGLENPELCAYHPANDFYEYNGISYTALLSGGLYVIDEQSSGIYVRSTDPAKLPTQTLSIYNFFNDKQHQKAAAAMDDVPIFFENDSYYSSAQELGQAMASGDNRFDILRVASTNIDFDRMAAKGYCLDLSSSKILTDYVNDLYPFMRDAVVKDGKLVGVPISMYAYGMKVNKKAFAELGIENIPDNWLDLIAFINDWAKPENEENREKYCVFQWEGTYKEQMFYNILSAYSDYFMANNQPLSLDTDMFRQLMNALNDMDASSLEVTVTWDEGDMPEELEELYNKTPLFYDSINYDVNYYDYNNSGEMWPLKLTPDVEIALPLNVQIMFVNPNSANQEAAIRYLEAYVQAADAETLANLSPNHNDPIESPYYEQSLMYQQRYLKQLEASINKATDETEKADLQEQYDAQVKYMAEFEKTGRYSATAESIAEYRAVMVHASLATPSILYKGDSDDFWTLRERYVDGQIGLEQFISEGEGKLRLMQLEDQ